MTKYNNIWLISDTHFGDEDFYTYTLENGKPARKFKNASEADNYMLEKFNSVVKENDKVYFLGDLGKKKVLREILPKLNGKRKILLKGNHDDESLGFYSQYFNDIRSYFVLDKILMSHIPVHQYCKGKYYMQVHGHTHMFNIPDKYYYNVCVEQHDYTPVNFEDIKKLIEPKTIKYLNHRESVDNVFKWCYNEDI